MPITTKNSTLTTENIIHTFYTAFQQKDYKTMQQCYADHAVFNDEVFKNLNAAEVRAMWEMLITRGKDLALEFTSVKTEGNKGSAQWTATYTFSATRRKVVNRIQAEFVFENNKIVSHTDRFDFKKWARQALGFKGFLLGGTGFLRQKVQQNARKNLETFMKKS